jgi:regulation of enolase protein 1 (concanavalin A-like superfamily)
MAFGSIRLAIVAALSLAFGSSALAQEAMPVKVVAAIKEATTFIRTDVDGDADGPVVSGSGFVIRAEGTTAYIVTNAHVITSLRGEKRLPAGATTKVIFLSGTKREARTVAETVAIVPERDLALLRVTNVANLPAAIDVASDGDPFETMTVYIFGFPFGQQLATGKGNPPVNVGRGQVSSIRRDDTERITSVLLDGALNPGNSGGPVVDAKGKLVGIARATIRGANIGFAISVPVLLETLAGKSEAATLSVRTSKQGEREISFDVPLVDPLDRIKSARLLFSRGPTKFSKTPLPVPVDPVGDDFDEQGDRPPVPDTRDSRVLYGPIEGAESLALEIARHHASGTIRFPSTGKDQTLWYQLALADGSGKTIHTQPAACFLGTSDRAYWGELVDPDGDCTWKLEDGSLVGDVPETLHDLNIDIHTMNGPRVIQEVAGDFVATVKVTGSFDPGHIPTGPRSVPYNGGGLLVWLDQGNYIRLERGAMYRNGRVMGLLIFESRENGTKAQGHNKGGLDPRTDLWLRVERKGNVIAGFFSRDGKEWDALEPMEVEWARTLKVGVDAINSSGDPMTVRFHDYVIAPLPGR